MFVRRGGQDELRKRMQNNLEKAKRKTRDAFCVNVSVACPHQNDAELDNSQIRIHEAPNVKVQPLFFIAHLPQYELTFLTFSSLVFAFI